MCTVQAVPSNLLLARLRLATRGGMAAAAGRGPASPQSERSREPSFVMRAHSAGMPPSTCTTSALTLPTALQQGGGWDGVCSRERASNNTVCPMHIAGQAAGSHYARRALSMHYINKKCTSCRPLTGSVAAAPPAWGAGRARCGRCLAARPTAQSLCSEHRYGGLSVLHIFFSACLMQRGASHWSGLRPGQDGSSHELILACGRRAGCHRRRRSPPPPTRTARCRPRRQGPCPQWRPPLHCISRHPSRASEPPLQQGGQHARVFVQAAGRPGRPPGCAPQSCANGSPSGLRAGPRQTNRQC